MSLYLSCEVCCAVTALPLLGLTTTFYEAYNGGEGECGEWPKQVSNLDEPCRSSSDSESYRRWVRDGVYKFGFELRKYVLGLLTRTFLTRGISQVCSVLSYSSRRKPTTIPSRGRYALVTEPVLAVGFTFYVIDRQLGVVRTASQTAYMRRLLILVHDIPPYRAQFARRDAIYNANTIRLTDSMVIICTISTAAGPPVASPPIPQRLVPREMLDALGGLLDE